ncbi:MAG: hypothetical protein AAF483_07075, partial [Planctomycetota bacterium]
MLRFIRVSCLLLIALSPTPAWAQYAVPQLSRAKPNKSDASDRAMAALELAKLAAQDGLVDVSFEAVRRAIGKGPPVKAVDLGGLLSSNPNASQAMMRMGGMGGMVADDSRQRLAEKLIELNKTW